MKNMLLFGAANQTAQNPLFTPKLNNGDGFKSKLFGDYVGLRKINKDDVKRSHESGFLNKLPINQRDDELADTSDSSREAQSETKNLNPFFNMDIKPAKRTRRATGLLGKRSKPGQQLNAN